MFKHRAVGFSRVFLSEQISIANIASQISRGTSGESLEYISKTNGRALSGYKQSVDNSVNKSGLVETIGVVTLPHRVALDLFNGYEVPTHDVIFVRNLRF